MNVEFMKDGSLSEIYQQIEIRFALVTQDGKQCHPFCKCRDFLSDAVVHAAQGTPPVSIYGFRYDKAKDPLVCPDETLMLVELCKGFNHDSIGRAVDLLNRLEEIGDMDGRTTAEPVDGWNRPVVLLRSPRGWVESPVMISAYTCVIRFCNRLLGPSTASLADDLIRDANLDLDNDGKYIKEVAPVLEKLLKEDRHRISMANYDYSKLNIHRLHDYCGLYSWGKAITPMQKEGV